MDDGLVTGAALLGAMVGVVGTLPYLRDMLRRQTLPHRGSWCVWSVIEVIAVASHHADGGRWLLVPLIGQAAGTVAVFGLSLRLGVGGLSRRDLSLVAVAGVGVWGWIQLDQPVVATVCVIGADLAGMVLMTPKALRTPHSETVATFALASLGGALAAMSVDELAPSLLIYPAYFCLANGVLATLIMHRRGALARFPAAADSSPLLT